MCNNTEIIKNEELSVIPVEEQQFYEDVREIWLCDDEKGTMVSFEKYYAYFKRGRTQFLFGQSG